MLSRMTMRMNEFFYGRHEQPRYWQQFDEHQRPYDDDYTADFSRSSGRHFPTIEFRVPMCCSKCEEKVREGLSELEGVYGVYCDQLSERVTVTGFVDPFQALKKVKRIQKKSEFWNGSPTTKTTTTSHRRQHRSFHNNGIHTPRLETLYRSYPSQVSNYYRDPAARGTYSHGLSQYRNTYTSNSYDDGASYYSGRRPSSPVPFSLPRYDTVPPYAQTYYTEDYPLQYASYYY